MRSKWHEKILKKIVKNIFLIVMGIFGIRICSKKSQNIGKILLLTNLPYIKNDDWENMSEDTRFEPKTALFGGEKTGFELYEKLFIEIFEKNLHGVILIEF